MKNEDLALEIQRGNRDKIPQLWTAVQAFVSRQARRRMAAHRLNYAEAAVDIDDLIQEGFLAMLQAADSYKPGGKMTFLGWLDLYLKTAFNEALGLRTVRDTRDPIRWAASLQQPLNAPEGETLADVLPISCAELEQIERDMWLTQLCDTMAAALAELPADMRRVLWGRYWQGQTVQQIAAAEGISHQGVSDRTGRALRKLRTQDAAGRLREFVYQS